MKTTNFLGKLKYEDLLNQYLSETISKFSSDDLSLNILYKEYLSNNDNISEKYFNEFMDGITNTNQIVQISSYAFHVDQTKNATKDHLFDITSIKEYLQWK